MNRVFPFLFFMSDHAAENVASVSNYVKKHLGGKPLEKEKGKTERNSRKGPSQEEK